MQQYSATYRIVDPLNDPHAVHPANKSTIWDLEDSDNTSNPSEYEDDGYTSTESMLRTPKVSGSRRKSAKGRANVCTRTPCQPIRSQSLKHIHGQKLEHANSGNSSQTLGMPLSPPQDLTVTAQRIDAPDLDGIWKLLENWYTRKGREKRPPCAVEQSRLAQLHYIGTRENVCDYIDRLGNKYHVISRPLRGWEERNLHIIVAFRDQQHPVIIRGRDYSSKLKGKDEGTATFPFYIWKGIPGDDEGWETEPSIFKIACYSNPKSDQPINSKKRRLDTPKSNHSLNSVAPAQRAPRSARKLQPLLSDVFPGLYAELTKWIRNDSSGKDPAFILNNQPELYRTKARPDQPISYVDIDGNHVEAGLCSTGVGNKHVIVAQGPSLEPAIISFDHIRRLPKCYTAYFKWVSTKTWIEPPCVFKVFGVGPYEPPRGFIQSSLGWLAQSSSADEVSGCSFQTVSISKASTIIPQTFHTPADLSPSIKPTDEGADQASTSTAPPEPQQSSALQIGGTAAPQSENSTLPPVFVEQTTEGSRNQPFKVPDDSSPIKNQRSDGLAVQVLIDSPARSSTTCLSMNQILPQSYPPGSDGKSASIAERVHFRFLTASAMEPRERSLAECNNVKMLFSNAKQGGLLKGESSMAPLLALQVPGMFEPIGICIGDSKDFAKFVLVLETALSSLEESKENVVVEVRADHFD